MQLDAWPMLEYLVSLNQPTNDNALEWFADREQYKYQTRSRIRTLTKLKLAWELLHAMEADSVAVSNP